MPNTNCSPQLQRFLDQQNNTLIKTLKDAIKNREIKEDDYPKISIACEYGPHRAFGHSSKCHASIRANTNYVPPLLNSLKRFGNPPEVKIKGSSLLFIGTCAEDSAANQVLEKCFVRNNRYPFLKDLVFTHPIRTRTHERKRFCDVCRAVF